VIRITTDDTTGFDQLRRYCFQIGTGSSLQHNIPTGNRRGTKEGARLNPVRHNGMLGTMQGRYALNTNHIGACTFNFGPHGDQAISQIHHFRLTGCVFNDRFAIRQSGGHHQIFCARHSHHIRTDPGTFQTTRRRLGMDITCLHMDFCAHGLQAFDVLIHRACTDGAASG